MAEKKCFLLGLLRASLYSRFLRVSIISFISELVKISRVARSVKSLVMSSRMPWTTSAIVEIMRGERYCEVNINLACVGMN